MTTVLADNLPLPSALAGLPYIHQYLGVWSMYEPAFNGLLGHAQQINVQLHLEKTQRAEAQAEIHARAATEVTVTAQKIALIELHGTLQKHVSSFSGGTSTVVARRQLRAAMRDDEVAGILLHIDSPGGAVAGTDDLAADVAAAAKRKPVYGYIEDMGASAAYWPGAQCTKLFAGASALVGSIGVFTVVYDLSKAAEDQGVKVHVVRFGAFKGMGVPGTEITEEQRAEIQRTVDAFGEDFVTAVAQGRGLTKTQARQLADGRVHKGTAALELKLIDGVQTIDETIAALVAETQQPKNRRTKAMASEQQTADKGGETLIASLGQTISLGATLEELKTALPKASNDFIVEQLGKKATLEQATQAFAEKMSAENAELKAKLEAAEKAAAERTSEPAPKPKGNAALNDLAGDQSGATGDGSATAAYQEKFDALVASGKSRFEAATIMGRKHDDLRQAMIAEQNAAAGRR